MRRSELINELANRILKLNLNLNHPIRVAVSGITASGKTTLANELALELRSKNREVIRTSIDNFHNPRAVRYRKGNDFSCRIL